MSCAFNVSDSIGFDGYSYFCRRCGKAGYSRATQVRGHLGMCPGTLIRKGVSPTTSCNQLPTGRGAVLQQPLANQLQPVREASYGGLSGSQLLQQPVVVDQVAGGYNYQLDRRVSRLENEYLHSLQQVNAPNLSIGGWIQQNIGLVILGVFVLIAAFSGRSCPPCQNGANRSSGPDMNKLTERILNKATDTAITKSFGRLFS